MKEMNPKIYVVIGLVLIAVSVPLAAGIVTQWPASAETWENTEILGAYGPARLTPGMELASIKVLVRNGYTSSGDVLIEIHVDGDANDCKAWQFTEYVKHEATKNVTLKFYREQPVMGEGPMTFTVEPGYSGSGEATHTVYPLGEAVENTTDTDDGLIDNITDLIDDILNPGNETDSTDTDDGVDSGSDDPGATELAIIEYLQTLAPRLTVETLTMGIVTMMLGLGLSGYGFSMRDQW